MRVDTPSSLITAINLGQEFIASSIYFENQISRIARQIVELEVWDANPEIDNVEGAVRCLKSLQKTSSMLMEEDKIVLKDAVKRMGGGGCACSIL